jgi:hypothetical protein
MKYLKTFESLYESPLIIELKDMALELTDVGFKVEVFKDGTNTTNNIIVIITHTNNFTIKTDVKEFLFRATGYMKDKGYEHDTHSNFGSLFLTEDGKIILPFAKNDDGFTLEITEDFPLFTMINILFKK